MCTVNKPYSENMYSRCVLEIFEKVERFAFAIVLSAYVP